MTVSVNGLAENLGQMLDITEDLMLNAIPDEDILENLKQDELMARQMAKANQNNCSNALNRYVIYGPEYVKSVTLSDEQVMALTSEQLLGLVKSVLDKEHTVLYYGPQDETEAKKVIAEHHKCSDNPGKLVKKYTKKQIVDQSKVFIAPYDSRQFNYIQYSDRGEKFSMDDVPAIELFNEYFGGGMNTIVFQEMREARALAYNASAYLSSPSYLDDTYCFYARIGSQNDKLKAAVEAFDLIINDMPESDKSFEIAKTGLESVLRTSRTTGMSVLNSYLNAKELGLTEPLAKKVYDTLAGLTMEDLVACQQKWVKGRTYIYGILGDVNDLDMNYLKSLGTVQQISLDELFGLK
jgi:predicted Zn-dependent peptidase